MDARVHQDALEVVPCYGLAVRRLLRDALPGAAALRLLDPSGEHAARKFVAGHPSHVAEPPQGALRYVPTSRAHRNLSDGKLLATFMHFLFFNYLLNTSSIT